MADRWIVTTHSYFEHKTFDEADAERVRLATKSPKKRFRVVRIKTSTWPSRAAENIALLRDRLAQAATRLRKRCDYSDLMTDDDVEALDGAVRALAETEPVAPKDAA